MPAAISDRRQRMKKMLWTTSTLLFLAWLELIILTPVLYKSVNYLGKCHLPHDTWFVVSVAVGMTIFTTLLSDALAIYGVWRRKASYLHVCRGLRCASYVQPLFLLPFTPHISSLPSHTLLSLFLLLIYYYIHQEFVMMLYRYCALLLERRRYQAMLRRSKDKGGSVIIDVTDFEADAPPLPNKEPLPMLTTL